MLPSDDAPKSEFSYGDNFTFGGNENNPQPMKQGRRGSGARMIPDDPVTNEMNNLDSLNNNLSSENSGFGKVLGQSSHDNQLTDMSTVASKVPARQGRRALIPQKTSTPPSYSGGRGSAGSDSSDFPASNNIENNCAPSWDGPSVNRIADRHPAPAKPDFGLGKKKRW